MISKLKDTLLLVGDMDSDRALLRGIFSSSYHLLEAENPDQARLLLKQNSDCIAAVLADISLSDHQEVRSLSCACSPDTETQIPFLLIITPLGTGQQEELAFTLGATDVILKPYTTFAIQRRVQIIVGFFVHKWNLEKMVVEQRETIRKSNQVMVDALSAIIEHRSAESGNHVLRIRRFTKILLEDVAQNCPEYGLTPETIDIIANAADLHDIGKISIPDAILNKPGKLTPAEFETMKTHTTVGSELVQQLSGIGDTEYLRYAYNIALYHHERWDGNGYPRGLAGDEIPICAQVVGIADVFDALTTARVYKPAFPCTQAVNMILNGECGTFSPKLLACFKHVRPQFVALAAQYSDGRSPKDDAITLPLPGPVWKTESMDTLQLSQVKYQTLLHYIDDTVLDVDLDHDLYHVVYNPNPELNSLLPTDSFRKIFRHLKTSGLHPEDTGVIDELYQFITKDFFQMNLRRRSFLFRLFSPLSGDYQPYELVFLRVNSATAEPRLVTVIWRKAKQNIAPSVSLPRTSLHAAPALLGLVSTALRCCSDRELTIDAGMQELYSLTGYTQQEITEQFDGKLLRLILPEDRAPFLSAMQEHLAKGGPVETEFRLLRKDAKPVWVLSKSRLYLEDNGQEYFYFAIRDNSQSKAVHQQLLSDIERNQILIDQSGSIVFDWDLTADTMYCSPKWKEHFGYAPVSRNYGSQLGIATHFHPDDLYLIRDAVEQIRQGTVTTASMDVRIANSDGRYRWTRITATGRRDKNGTLLRILGLLQDIDELKRAALVLKEQAERDALTKLFNKTSTQQLSTEYLEQREADALAALLVLDLDNFKSVNDSYGHLYGDAFLARVGSNLRKLFRPSDIIGRIGGDEFLILLKDIPDEGLLRNRCQLLLETFRDLFSELAPALDISFSIGAALAPTHGTGYNELFQYADEALYLAKSKGKNGYQIYNPRSHFAKRKDAHTRPNTRIESDEQPGLANDSFSRFVFRRLYESRDFERTINEIISYIGEQFNVSRVYIFENNEDNTTCSNTFEWCNEGIPPEKENLQNVSYIDDISGWPDVFDERGIFYCTDVTALEPHFRAILEPQGIKSMLQCAIMDSGVFRGYVGFDECTSHRMWTQEQVSLLEFLAEMLAAFLLKKRIRDRAVLQAANLRSVLDRQDAWIYVIDPDTCELKFLNAKTKQIAPESREGMVCYKAFMARDSRCENCPAANIRQTKNADAIIENDNLSVRVRARASQISWNGEDSCLIFCQELPFDSTDR